MILKKLHSRVDLSCCPTSNQINVSRDNILQGSLHAFKRRRFNPEARLDVIFVDSDGVGEGAIDDGGPTREYLRLLMREIQISKIFEGPEDNRLLALDTHGEDYLICFSFFLMKLKYMYILKKNIYVYICICMCVFFST